jgi:hypothetical protein
VVAAAEAAAEVPGRSPLPRLPSRPDKSESPEAAAAEEEAVGEAAAAAERRNYRPLTIAGCAK